MDELEEAFSIEKVTEEFFQLYCEKFHQLREHLGKNDDFVIESEQHNFSSAQFAKKLMGQIVFLYFLQKKGWLGVSAWPKKLTEKEYKNAFYARGAKSRELIPVVYRPAADGTYVISGAGLESLDNADEAVLASCVKGEPWGTGPQNFMRKLFEVAVRRKENFFDDYLEPLFYEALNVNRGEQGYCPALHCRIPFLSGGLFEPIDGYEWEHNDFNIPNTLFSNRIDNNGRTGDGILDIFDRYNFTMSEDEPMEREVAIDPEMLGKVFENLLEVEDRKSKGAFYTPREIVHYICQESLINYLANTMSLPINDVREFMLYGDFMKDEDTRKDKREGNCGMFIAESLFKVEPDGQVSVNRLVDMDKALANVRVVDPAVGSGAFPLGMLNEIVRARQNITEYLIVEQKSHAKPSQEAFISRQMHTDRSAYRLKYETVKNCIFAADIEPSAVDITQLRLWLSLVIDDEITPDAQTPLDGHRNPLPLPNLECNILCGNSLVDEFAGIRLINDSVLLGNKEYQIYTDQDFYESTLCALMDAQNELFKCDSTKKKEELKKRIAGLRDVIIMGQLEGASIETLNAYEETKHMASKPYVLWQLDFARVFREKGGFDIVVGNPPYFNIQTLGAKSPLASLIMKRYSEIWMDKSDILFYFIYLGHLLSIGEVAFITSNAYLFSTKAKRLRNFIVEKMPIRRITNFENYMVFNAASITSCITFFEQFNIHGGRIPQAKVLSESLLPLSEVLYNDSMYFDISLKKDESFLLVPSNIRELDEKIKQGHPQLGTLLKVGKGMETAANEVFLFDEKPSFPAQYIRRRVAGDMIHRYSLSAPTQFLIYYEWASSFDELDTRVQSYLLDNRAFLEGRATVKNEGRDWWRYSRPMHKEYYKYSKIWCSYRGKSNAFALDESDTLIGFTNTTAIFDTSDSIDIRYILALVNSELLEYQHKRNAKQTGGGVFEYFPNTIERYPIPVISSKEQQPLISLIDEILRLKTHDIAVDTSEIESKIDAMVYELYKLDEGEISIVKNYIKGT